MPLSALRKFVLRTLCILPLVSTAACLHQARPCSTLPSPDAVDAATQRLMPAAQVQGMALAFIDEGQVCHVAAYGLRNVERREPLRVDSIMYGASLTKTAFAYLVLQLVDEKRLDLDTSIAHYLPKPLSEYKDYADLASDARWRALTPRIILNHSTGLANFRWLEPDGKLTFHFEPGTRYAYSGEGIQILQTVLEEGLGLDVGAEMQKRIFDRFGMKNTSMTWRPDFARNMADGYAIDGSFEPHDERSRVRAAGSMDTTIADQALLWAAIVRGDGLSRAARQELVRPQLPISSKAQFPTLAVDSDPRGPKINLAAGTGVIAFRDHEGGSWFKGGHNEWTGNMLICQELKRRCLVLLANSVRAELIYPSLATSILGPSAMPWWWEYGEKAAKPITGS